MAQVIQARSGPERSPRRVPPHNLAAEQSLLGAMLLSGDAIADASEMVEGHHFYKPAHGHVFDAIIRLYNQGEAVDAVTVADELRRAGALEMVGGEEALLDLAASTPATSNAAHYARIVEEHASLRRLIAIANEIADEAYQMPDDVAAMIDQAEGKVFGLSERRVADTTKVLTDLLDETLNRLEELYARGEGITGTPTGFSDLDELLSGLQPSALLVLGARPAMGKSALALGMATHVAVHERRPVLFFSLEMSHLELSQRILCAEARVDSKRMRNGQLQDNDWPRITNAVTRLAEAPLFIDDNPNLTVMEIRAKSRRLKAKLGSLGLVVVDYLQLMTGRTSAENRQVEVSEISRGLKILARELECPVVALSQLSRRVDERTDKRPLLSDLRESGCLTASTRILRADTGRPTALGELLAAGARDIPVWTVADDGRIVEGRMTHVFPSGTKPVFRLRLASGLDVEASGNHPFLTVGGWKALDDLSVGEGVAVPRRLPTPTRPTSWPEDEIVLLAHLLRRTSFDDPGPLRYRSDVAENLEAVEKAAVHFGVTARVERRDRGWDLVLAGEGDAAESAPAEVTGWLTGLGLARTAPAERFVPGPVFGLDDGSVALFLRHLWAAGGHLGRRARSVTCHYATASLRLADDVRHLLLRFGIHTRRTTVHEHGHRPVHHLWVHGAANQRRFLEQIGVHGPAGEQAADLLVHLDAVVDGELDTLPAEVWDQALAAAAGRGMGHRELSTRMGWSGGDGQHFRAAPSRAAVAGLAEVLDDDRLRALGTGDLLWDEVVAIEPLGEQPVYDATVPGTHNFVADGIVVHNSIEQDADVVMFIYRDEHYHHDTDAQGMAEVIVAKHRNGPTGKVDLVFLGHLTRFADLART